MPSTFPAAPDDLGRDGLTHGDVSDALAAVETSVTGLLAAPSARFLSGSGAPAAGSGLDPLDGVSDPWRWSPSFGGWVGPAYEVSWAEGDTLQSPPGVAGDSYIVFGPGLPAGAVGIAYVVTTGIVSTDGSTTYQQSSGTTTTFGTGVLVAVQYEPDFTHTTVPDKTLDVTTLTTATVGAVHEFPEGTIGSDGDTYRDTSAPAGTLVLYGPKANGAWPAPQTFTSDNANTAPVLTSPDGTAYTLTVADDGTLSTEPA